MLGFVSCPYCGADSSVLIIDAQLTSNDTWYVVVECLECHLMREFKYKHKINSQIIADDWNNYCDKHSTWAIPMDNID